MFHHNHGARSPRGVASAEFGFRGFRGGRRHGRRGGRRHGRIFDHGDLRFVILQMIAESPKHGYEIIKAIEEKLGGSYSPSPGVIYPTLTLLEELGYATLNASEGSKKLYAITRDGSAYLDANRASVDEIFARIAEVHSAHGGGTAPQIVRAMENLTLALRMRLARGPLTEEQNRAVAAAIDAAAVAVERS
jgi:DNA-binding PadR family transcriptional regulator